MNKTLIIGANGQIGRLLIDLMSQQNLPVRAMLRDTAHVDFFERFGAETVIDDLEQPLADASFLGCDKVVFTAGSGGKTGADKTILVDLWGACKAIDMAKKHDIKQFVMISAQNAGDPDNGNPAIKHYNICKHFADEYLQNSGVPYTILRPGRLTNDAATGHIQTTRPDNKEQRIISRSDVAASIVQCLDHSEAVNQIDELYHGDTPISDAFIQAIQGRLG